MANAQYQRLPSAPGEQSDPYYTIKSRVDNGVRQLQSDFEKWKDLLESANTSTSGDFAAMTERVTRSMNDLSESIALISKTVYAVERNRARFKHITDTELADRKEFINTSTRLVDDVKRTLSSDRVKAKKERDDALLGARRQSETSLDRVIRAEQNDAVASRMQTVQALEQKQDEVLTEMTDALKQLGVMAGSIGDELEDQNREIEEFDTEVTTVQERLENTLKKIDKLLSKSNWGKYCCIIFLLVLLIILFLAVIYA